MLERLHVENLAVIESVDLDLSAGFSVLTGETGAGKSVLIHSLNMLLGERVGKDLVRSGCSKAVVSGIFTDLPAVTVSLLKEQGFDAEDEVLIQRELTEDGRSSVRINGRPATVSMLRSFGGQLVNIHGQHDNRALLDPATHVRYLDAFAKNDAQRSAYREIFSSLKDVLKRISQVDSDEQTRMQRMDLLSYQVNEIDAADLKVGEEEELSRRRTVLANAEKIESALTSVYASVSADGGARDRISEAKYDLEAVSNYDSVLAELSNRLASLSDELDDISAELRDFLDGQSFDPTELNSVEERLDLIYRLKRKYGADEEEILAFRDRAASELETLTSSAEILEQLHAEKKRLFGELKIAAAALTESRRKAGKTLEKSLTEQLAFLDMQNTGFCVQIQPSKDFTPTGADIVEFLLSANLGESLRPLSKIASGGELSRMMLAMKAVLSLDEDASTLIFDEIDTGVSGKAAEKIAMKLKELSCGKQVLVVTHLAQIAAYGDSHYLIAKAVSDSRTRTSVTPLSIDGRVNELARIMGGISPTDATLAAARDLLSRGTGK